MRTCAKLMSSGLSSAFAIIVLITGVLCPRSDMKENKLLYSMGYAIAYA
jgi:hypothetical protein